MGPWKTPEPCTVNP
jgi:hypothetical protein